jgi:hypothetical protein
VEIAREVAQEIEWDLLKNGFEQAHLLWVVDRQQEAGKTKVKGLVKNFTRF